MDIPQSQEELAALSWTDLDALSAQCAATDGTDYRHLLGFTKDAEVDGLGPVKAKLIGINHDDLVDGSGKAGFTVQLTDGLSRDVPTTFNMTDGAVPGSWWGTTVMRETNLPVLKAALPQELQGLMRRVRKLTGDKSSGPDVVETEDDLFLLSLIESIGTGHYWYYDRNAIEDSERIVDGLYLAYEGYQYEYYESRNTDMHSACASHKITDETGRAECWALRSKVDSLWTEKEDAGYYFGHDNGSNAYVELTSRVYLRILKGSLPAAAFCLSGAVSGGGGSVSDQRILLATDPVSWGVHDGSSRALGADPVEWRQPSGTMLTADGWEGYGAGPAPATS